MIENFKAVIRPSLAVWAMLMFTLSFFLEKTMGTPLTWICTACLLEWVTERGVKRAKELFFGNGK